MRGNVPLAIAAGGGGGGATDYCCADGGGGGGGVGQLGFSPGLNTPLDSSTDGSATNHVHPMRNDFSADDYNGTLGEDTAGKDPRDSRNMPPYAKHHDRGFAPNASYGVLATGGSGGDVSNSLAR